MTPEHRQLLETDRLTSLMPMIYVAWADGELTDDETTLIHKHCESLLDEASLDALAPWLDHANPPDASELLQLLNVLQERSLALKTTERVSLAELGYAIAALEHHEEAWFSSGLLNALSELEASLGFAGAEATRDILRETPSYTHTIDESPSAFDIATMSEWLDGPYRDRKVHVRNVLAGDDRFSYAYDVDTDGQRDHVWSWLGILAEEGFGKLAYPGVTTDTDLGHFVATFETLAYFDMSLVIKFGVQFGLWGGSVYFLGSDEQRDRWLADVATAEIPGCFAMSELGHGSNVRDLGTTARFDEKTDEWVLHTPDEASRKEWIGNAAKHGQMATVFAQLAVGDEHYGVHAFVVPIRDADGQPLDGIRIQDNGHKMGLNGVDNGRLWFDHVRIPRTNLLSRYATVDTQGNYYSPIASPSRRFFTMLGTLVGGRIAVGAAGNSASKTALTIAIRYAARRRQFGPDGAEETPILDYRLHQRRLMPLLAKTYALSFALQDLTTRYLSKTEDDAREVESLAAGLKSYSTWNATRTIQECREACGGQGYLRTNRLASLKEDTDIFTTFEGDNTVLMLLVAKAQLSNFKEQFADSSLFSMIRYVADRAATAVNEMNPVVTRDIDEEHLRSDEFWLAALRYREVDLVASVATRLKARLDKKMDPFEAFNEVQDHLFSAAHAHIERVIGESIQAAIDRCEDFEIRRHLELVAALYGLSCVYEDSGWFLEQGYIAGTKARAIRTQINTLCEELRDQAVHLVDAFDIPDKLLGAPIGLGQTSG